MEDRKPGLQANCQRCGRDRGKSLLLLSVRGKADCRVRILRPSPTSCISWPPHFIYSQLLPLKFALIPSTTGLLMAPWICKCCSCLPNFPASSTNELHLIFWGLLWCTWDLAPLNHTPLSPKFNGYNRYFNQYTFPLGLRITVVTLEISDVILKKQNCLWT